MQSELFSGCFFVLKICHINIAKKNVKKKGKIIMAKIVKINTNTGKEVLAVHLGNGFYVDENGVRHMPSEEAVRGTRNIPANVRAAFEHAENLYKRYNKLEAKKDKLLTEIKKQKDALDEEEKLVFKELRDAQGVLSRSEFVQAFYDALSVEVKTAMQRMGFSIGDTPYSMCYNDDNIYIIRNIELYKQYKRVPYCYEEYDGSWFLCDEAEEMDAYKKDIKRTEKVLPVQMPIHSYLWTGDRFSTWYSGVYEIEVSERMTITYAKELAKKFAK